ncbi:MAG: omptin family outer membrane protease [Deltaproteobacteria bacterium]|nr:omptin family outer membrane protease [Deltaproteobacteria bacterium]
MKSARFSIMGVFLAFIFLAMSPFAHSQQGFLESYNPVNLSQPTGNSYLNLMVGLRKYFNSFTSWQLPAANGPQDPISRLEYPWDQTFLAIKVGAAYTGLEVNMEWSGTLSVFSNSKAQDSDWEDPNNPGQKTTFAEAEATPRCWIIDLSCNMQIPGFSFLKGVAGYRTSQFKFTNTDGYQYGIYDSENRLYGWYSLPLPGANIEFSQYYQHLYAGGILDTAINLGEISNGLTIPSLLLRIQADASYVTGNSHDQHLLRYAFGIINSRGFGWHVNLTTGIKTGRFRFDLEADVRSIRTNGRIESIQEDRGSIFDVFVDGAKAWSEQKYAGINGTIFF